MKYGPNNKHFRREISESVLRFTHKATKGKTSVHMEFVYFIACHPEGAGKRYGTSCYFFYYFLILDQ